MKTFELHRETDVSGVSGTGIVAQGATFDGGVTVIHWLGAIGSTAVYPSFDAMKAIHCHGGATKIVSTGNAFKRGMVDCLQDGFENAPFGSVGGLEARAALRAPWYIGPREEEDYLGGYRTQALLSYGKDWATCPFSWGVVLTIGSDGSISPAEAAS